MLEGENICKCRYSWYNPELVSGFPDFLKILTKNQTSSGTRFTLGQDSQLNDQPWHKQMTIGLQTGVFFEASERTPIQFQDFMETPDDNSGRYSWYNLLALAQIHLNLIQGLVLKKNTSLEIFTFKSTHWFQYLEAWINTGHLK